VIGERLLSGEGIGLKKGWGAIFGDGETT